MAWMLRKPSDWATRFLIIVNVAVFAWMWWDGVDTEAEYLSWGVNYAPYVMSGEYWRLFTSMFIHFGAIHLVMNMLALNALGPLVEMVYGWRKTLLVYTLCGVVASLTSISFNPVVLSAGASGAIFGLMGVFITLLLRKKIVSRIPGHSPLRSVLQALALNIVISLLPGIDFAAHMGGLLMGFLIAWILD